MEIRLTDNSKEWDDWFIQQKQASFLQSYEWGSLQEENGREVKRWQIINENGVVVGQAQGIKNKLGFGIEYWYLPHVSLQQTILEFFLSFLKKTENSACFVRIESINECSFNNKRKKVVSNRQPATTMILNLEQEEEQILATMHPKTRYNIRLAEKKGVRIEYGKNSDIFWTLNQVTSNRDKIRSHEKEYYQKLLEHNFCFQVTAYFESQPIASNLFVKFKDTFTYLHGSSSNEHRNLMAPYLLQWCGIKMAKELGCKYYDFWGISPLAKEGDGKTSSFHELCWTANHPWTGVTRFKAGFGGQRISYPPAVDIIFSLLRYKMYELGRKIKGMN